jgi:FKBP-type peptidyl-prolyl cis-trans isomerase SlyD
VGTHIAINKASTLFYNPAHTDPDSQGLFHLVKGNTHMQTEPQAVSDGMVVSIGEEVSRMTANEPLEYLHGYQEIVPGLEAALTGKQVGDKFSITLAAADGYGDYDSENFDEIPRDAVPFGDDVEIGTDLEVEDEEGNVYLATVAEIRESTLLLDFNHPLAGKTLEYDVEVTDIRYADEEELEHGHAHGYFLDDELDFDDDDFDDEEAFEDDEDESKSSR